MAATIIKSPAPLNFAGNPIVYHIKTSRSLGEGESFLRIILRADFNIEGVIPYYTGPTSFEVELSQPVEDGGTAVFNLSDAAQTLIRRVQAQMDMNSGDTFYGIGLSCVFMYADAWNKDGQQNTSGWGTSSRIHVVPGRLTDFEMLVMNDIYLPDLAGAGRAMTRKPDGGVVYAGETLIVPTLRGVDSSEIVSTVQFSVGGTQIYSGADYIVGYRMDYQSASPTDQSVEGEFVFSSSLSGSITGLYRGNPAGVHFLRFINGFGAVENIAVRSKDKLSYAVEGEVHSLVQEASVRPTDRRYAVKSQPVGVYELSSGYVPQRWAEWYVQELLTSPRVWIQLGGKWVPALIEAEDDCVVYDRTKPEMPHVDFTLRLAIDGVTGCTW